MDTTITPHTLDLSTMDTDNSENGAAGIAPFKVFNFVIGCLGLLGNSFVCLVYLHPGTQRNQTNLLITHQAFIDAGSSILFVFYSVYDIIDIDSFENSTFEAVFCFVVKSRILIFISLALSTYNLTLISIERYFATVHPVRYPRIFARKYLRIMVATVWLIAPVPQYFILWESRRFQDGACIVEWSLKSSGIILFAWEYFIPVSVMSFSFISIVTKLHRSKNSASGRSRPTRSNTIPAVSLVGGKCQTSQNDQNDIRDAAINSRGSGHDTKSSLADVSATATSTTSLSASVASIASSLMYRKQTVDKLGKRKVTSWRAHATKTLLVVYVMYIVCWTPNQCAFLLLAISGSLNYRLPIYQATVLLAFFNSCVNPFIYALRHKTYKDKVCALFAGCKKCLCSCTGS